MHVLPLFLEASLYVLEGVHPLLSHTRRSHNWTSPTRRLIPGTMVISVLCLSVKSSGEGKSVLLIAHEHAVSIRTLFEFGRVCNDPRLRRCARSGKKAGHEDYAPISFAAAWPIEDGIINSPFPDMLILSG